jgi:hypothetical protein
LNAEKAAQSGAVLDVVASQCGVHVGPDFCGEGIEVCVIRLNETGWGTGDRIVEAGQIVLRPDYLLCGGLRLEIPSWSKAERKCRNNEGGNQRIAARV